jgi:hypothetical protein
MHSTFQKAKWKDFKGFTIQMKNIWGDRYVQYDLDKIQCKYILRQYTLTQ